MTLNNKHLTGLIILAVLLLAGTVFSSIQTALKNPAGKILNSTDYGYQAKELEDSVFVYTGTTVLFGGSGRVINETPPIVAEIKYSSGSVTMHRKIAISSGSVVNESPKLYKIYLGSGAIIYDALTDDGDAGLFKSIHKKGVIKIMVEGEVLMFGQGEWDYVDGNDKEIEIKFTEKNSAGKTIQKTVIVLADDLNADNAEDIIINLSSGSEVTEIETIEVAETKPAKKITKFEEEAPPPVIVPNPVVNETDPTPPEIINEEPEPVTTTPTPTPTQPQTEPTPTQPNPQPTVTTPTEDTNTLLWGEYPDTDEGNYDLATDKLNANYCDRIDDSLLRFTCKEVIYEAIGKCDLLSDPTKQLICKNAHTKQLAINSDRIAKCMEIKDDTALINSCISEINQNLYDAAIEAGDANICKAIYNASMIQKCKEALGVFE